MTTTIQVHDSTKLLLDLLKEKTPAMTYDAIIKQLIEEEIALPSSLFGHTKGKLKKIEHVESHEL